MFKKITKIFILTLIISTGTFAYSAEISMQSANSNIYTGDIFKVTILLNTKESANAIDGVIKYPKEILKLKEISDGNSVINFWIEKRELSDDQVIFSGITPGGIRGTNQKILTLVFEAQKEGSASIIFENSSALASDGNATNILSSIKNITLDIGKGEDNSSFESTVDLEIPENFNPEIIKDENIFDSKNTLIFATQDKESGISHYQVKEGYLSFYKEVESPYLLKNQKLNKDIFIKAFDMQGNYRLVKIEAQNPEQMYVIVIKIIVLILIIWSIILLIRKYVLK
ncbi:MAG: hypothetical protein RLY43_1529 [Bacteroidota bacterium]|jgi:TusA-related sulfurtransferase